MKLRHRIAKPYWYMKIAQLMSERSTCLRRQVGAIAVRDGRILTTGYNGPPSGMDHCLPTTCVRIVENIPSGQSLERCKALHAEQNLIVQAALTGVVLEGCTVYCTHAPCTTCTKLLLGIGVERIVVANDYPDEYGEALREEAGVCYEVLDMSKVSPTEQDSPIEVLYHFPKKVAELKVVDATGLLDKLAEVTGPVPEDKSILISGTKQYARFIVTDADGTVHKSPTSEGIGQDPVSDDWTKLVDQTYAECLAHFTDPVLTREEFEVEFRKAYVPRANIAFECLETENFKAFAVAFAKSKQDVANG